MSEQKIIKEKQIKDSYTEVTQRRKKKTSVTSFLKLHTSIMNFTSQNTTQIKSNNSTHRLHKQQNMHTRTEVTQQNKKCIKKFEDKPDQKISML
jgi:hypothetical protein